MIKVDKLDLVKFTQDVYSLSTPQGLGHFQAKEGGLTENEAKEIVGRFSNDKYCALSLDYVQGRACKMTVSHSEDGGFELSDSWYDHSESQYNELLSKHGIAREETPPEKQASEKGLGVPVGCTLDPMLQLAIAMGGAHPCDGCNMNREVCKGYAKKERLGFSR